MPKLELDSITIPDEEGGWHLRLYNGKPAMMLGDDPSHRVEVDGDELVFYSVEPVGYQNHDLELRVPKGLLLGLLMIQDGERRG